jgi:hypothetical protein
VRRAGSLVAALLVFGCAAAAAEEPPELNHFLAERPQVALRLTEPIARCVARRDTANPAFHGCVDWHSAVHGTWALVAYGWATGDRRHRALIEENLKPAFIAEERRHLAADPDFEMPYGRAWFLRLAIDYRRAGGGDLLDGMAEDVAASLVAHFTQVPPDPTAIAYQSATWALLNLNDYAAAKHDARITAFVAGAVRAHYLTAAACPLQSVEVATAEFMAVCTNWAWLVSEVLPREEFLPWLARFLPTSLDLAPIAVPASVHQSALNFSRAWGLWRLYRATGDRRFLAAYLAHFDRNFADPQLWNGGYRTVAHWVAQFGMLALIETYYDGL